MMKIRLLQLREGAKRQGGGAADERTYFQMMDLMFWTFEPFNFKMLMDAFIYFSLKEGENMTKNTKKKE